MEEDGETALQSRVPYSWISFRLAYQNRQPVKGGDTIIEDDDEEQNGTNFVYNLHWRCQVLESPPSVSGKVKKMQRNCKRQNLQ